MLWPKKKPKKIDLLSLSDLEKAEMIKKIRRILKERMKTERSLRELLEAETITIEGSIVYDASEPLRGVTIPKEP